MKQNDSQFWQGKTAVITGASGGIGRALSLRLAEMGLGLLLTGRRQDALEETAAMVRRAGGQAEIYAADLTVPGRIDDLLRTAEQTFGGLDVLINNAGMAQRSSFEEVTEEDFNRIMATNARVPYFLCQRALPYLRRSDCATVINICSVTAHKGYPQQSVYAASKHALLGLSKSLANEVFRENIRVHVISPGGVYTDMVALARPDLSPEGMILAEDVADIAAFYLSKRMSSAVVDEIEVHRVNKEPFA